MKKILFTPIILLLFFINCTAQNTAIPDPNFEQALIDLGYDTVLDGNVLTANINTITSLNVNNKGIGQLNGIEDFIALEVLQCSNNYLNNLNLNSNIQLTFLNCSNNLIPLNLLSISNCVNLTILYCGFNNITTLNISNNTLLTNVDCSYNNLTTLNTSNNILLTSLNCNFNDITSLDLSNNTVLSNLNSAGNNLSELNIDNNPLLENINIAGLSYIGTFKNNHITSLNLSNNTQLTSLNTSWNPLTSLNLSNNTLLETLYCYQNLLNNLNLSANSNLIELNCSFNNLSHLNVKNGNNANFTSFWANDNPNLYCIEVDNENYSTTNWTNIDPASTFSNNCNSFTVVLDDAFEQKLIDLGYDSVLDNLVTTTNINNITNIDISNLGISDLTGIEDFTALTSLICNDNNLASIDLSNNTQLTTLYCYNNVLTELNLTNNTALTELRCYSNSLTNLELINNTQLTKLICAGNSITSLELAFNHSLTYLDCSFNQLTTLNVKNGNNSNFTVFSALNNIDLTCIKVDNTTYSTTNWINIDVTASYSEDCGTTYVPDIFFEKYLETHDALGNEVTVGDSTSMGNGIASDNYVNTANINTVTSLNISNQNISNTIGIEDFIALETLNCDNNQLTSINLSSLTALTSLYISNNLLSSINIDSNTALTLLYCGYNQLNNLSLQNNINLLYLSCYVNQISSLDLSKNIALRSLKCQSNLLQNLNVSKNTALFRLQCQNNQLTNLYLNDNTLLTELNCNTNQLEILSLKNNNNSNFTSFSSINNSNLTCIQVDDATYSTTNWTNIDTTSSFSNDCNYGVTFIPDNNFEQALINLGYDTVLDNLVTTTNINTLTFLNVKNRNISDLTGIQDFTQLIGIDCSQNNISNLDVSLNYQLTNLECSLNNLSNLNTSGNTLLTILSCSNNNLSNLDISNNPLDVLICNYNDIETLNVSNLQSLSHLECRNNQLTNLNVKNNHNSYFTIFDAQVNPNLFCIEVDDVAYSTTNWTNIDPQTSFSNYCNPTIKLSINTFLQGAYINPNTGEETLMRDDLRIANLIPTTSPYADALTCNPNIFTTTGNNAIVDWVWVELRNKNDNTAILDSQSALLQRDGDIVSVDGISPISFINADDNYFVAISHRTHLGIITANSITLLNNAITNLDLSSGTSVVDGGSNAIIDLGNGKFGLYSGDFDGNGQIQNTDLTSVTPLLGQPASYEDADLDMNAQVQNTDINNLLNPNKGKGLQFRMLNLKLFAKRTKH